ncbi:MAG: hypothetical protein ACOH15_05495 [Acetobacterium sp.]
MSGSANGYYPQKIRLLKEYVSKSEELLSSLAAWETLNLILTDRDHLIQKLQSLETEFDNEAVERGCSQDQKDQIEALTRLILDIDQDGIKMIKDEKDKIIGELKINQQSQKALDYGLKKDTRHGEFLDSKK